MGASRKATGKDPTPVFRIVSGCSVMDNACSVCVKSVTERFHSTPLH